MERLPLLYFACVLAGFALLKVPVGGTFLAGLDQVLDIMGILAVTIFSIVILYLGVVALLKKKF
ncbi:hypothetical protein EV207_10254 [Scopulibacillus darangshiensis]|uniref:Uncharacterized protein n=1 Tax=Scopulibacillus darangshiensis TaxID=442528 RepID=A0A4R2PCA8_9BACL|nr:hypothetical protein [Scopulibacillus darangshiensis]TCP31565.1 hypothetical protein EV207_10254 [Scopulibacillus darangshiensis]